MFRRQDDLKLEQYQTPEEKLFEKRLLFLYGAILGTPPRGDSMCPTFIADALIALDHYNHDPIRIVIDSPGGQVSTGLMLYDMMKLVRSPVYTYGRYCMSMAAIILAAGEPGHRYVFPNSTVMLHLPSGYIEGDADTMEKHAKHIKGIKERLVHILMENGCPHSQRQVLKDINREFFLTAEEAIDYGLADRIVTPEDLYFGPFHDASEVQLTAPLGKKLKGLTAGS